MDLYKESTTTEIKWNNMWWFSLNCIAYVLCLQFFVPTLSFYMLHLWVCFRHWGQISVSALYIKVKSAKHVGLHFLVKLPQKIGCVSYIVTWIWNYTWHFVLFGRRNVLFGLCSSNVGVTAAWKHMIQVQIKYFFGIKN